VYSPTFFRILSGDEIYGDEQSPSLKQRLRLKHQQCRGSFISREITNRRTEKFDSSMRTLVRDTIWPKRHGEPIYHCVLGPVQQANCHRIIPSLSLKFLTVKYWKISQCVAFNSLHPALRIDHQPVAETGSLTSVTSPAVVMINGSSGVRAVVSLDF